VPGALVLGLHVARIERIDGRQQCDAVRDIQASALQEVELVRVIGKQPDAHRDWASEIRLADDDGKVFGVAMGLTEQHERAVIAGRDGNVRVTSRAAQA